MAFYKSTFRGVTIYLGEIKPPPPPPPPTEPFEWKDADGFRVPAGFHLFPTDRRFNC